MYLCIRHHVPRFSDVFIPKANENICTFVTQLFPTTQWHFIKIKLYTYFSKVSFQTLFQKTKLNGVSVIAAGQFRASSIFLLLIDGTKNKALWCHLTP